MVTLDDYKKAILAAYMQSKNGEQAEFLLQPTPARLKNLSLFLLNENATDIEVYKRFFIFKDDESIAKQIENFDTDKFKPLSNFLKGKSELSSLNSLNLLAVLVDCNPRPYSKFRNGRNILAGEILRSNESSLAEDYVKEDLVVVEGEGRTNTVKVIERKDIAAGNSNSTTLAWIKMFYTVNNSKIVKNVLAAALCIALLFAAKNTFFKEDGCMVWNGDHYDIVPCNVQGNSFAGAAVIVPLDKETFAYQKKIEVCDTTVFFLPNGLPRIWYCKTGKDKIEYFSYHGIHPVTGKTLKKITPYMINKYVKHKQQ